MELIFLLRDSDDPTLCIDVEPVLPEGGIMVIWVSEDWASGFRAETSAFSGVRRMFGFWRDIEVASAKAEIVLTHGS